MHDGQMSEGRFILKRLLLLEDDYEQAELTRRFFRARSFDVRVEHLASRALETAPVFQPQVVIVDLVIKSGGRSVPDGGFTFIPEFRKLAAGARIPLIVTTGLPILGQDWMDNYGVALMLPKPFDLNVLGAKVDELVETV